MGTVCYLAKSAFSPLQEAVDLTRARPAQSHPNGRSTTMGQRDIPEQIRKLAELRDSGVLTNDEFEAKNGLRRL